MHWKEKEKLWYKHLKEVCVNYNWKFKSFYIYIQIGDLYFSASFYIDRKENLLSGWLEYKPLNIDNIFWDIVGLHENKKMPLSFRGNAAFSVNSINFWEYKESISNEKNPGKEINSLLIKINNKAISKAKKIKTTNDFYKELIKDEDLNSAGIITSLIEQKKYKPALIKIKEYKNRDISSGFGFGNKDFYDLAKSYCLKHSN